VTLRNGFDLSTVFRTVAAAVSDQELLVHGDLRLTYGQVDGHVDALAHFLAGRGLGCHTERAALAGHESGQDHVGLYLHNGPEYLEAMIASYRARAVPVNINYRYVAEELAYVLVDAGTRALVFHSCFARQVEHVRDLVPTLDVLVQVPDDSGADLLPGAVWWADALATPADGELPEPTGDDLYVVYTGGTTGMPKGVLWRQDDMYVTSMGGTPFGTTEPYESYEAIAENARAANGGMTLLMALPFMHGAAQWSTFHMITSGGKIVLPDDVRSFDADAVLRTVVREGCVSLPVVGDAMVRPIIAALESGDHDLSGLAAVNNGAAPLSPAVRARLMELLPHILVMDAAGSSETGLQMSSMSLKGMEAEAATFSPVPTTTVVSEDMSRVVVPGEEQGSGGGWLAQRGRVPLGYLGDPEKTARTFPLIGGERFSVPGDRAEMLEDGRIRLLGRDGVTINSGGEKIFAEEVERAVGAHPAVRDVIVVGRPSERWGSEPVAIVSLVEEVDDDALLAVASEHVARYKLPKAFLRVEHVVRSPSGKADYRWAKDRVEELVRA
jgi:fatty-acyl-CoA synthase